jgi:hypothetical protein
MRLDFNVRGETARQIRERAAQVVREFVGAPTIESLDQVLDMEINVEGTPAGENSESPLPGYNFVAHVHVRIKS